MKLYNTLTKEVEEFIPNNKDEVKMYTCGPTVYHYAHIGNLRTYIFEDILEKALNYLGYKVNRVMNITDVGHLTSDADTGEDKMEKGAKREGKTVYEIAKFYTDAFFNDCKKLNIKKPNTVEPASHNIDTYIKMIEKMLNDGYAYISVDPIFAATVDLQSEYYVFLQKYGNGDCWVNETTPGYFVVWGTPGLKFAWEIKAKQFDHANARLDQKYRNENNDDPFLDRYIDYDLAAAEYIKQLEEERMRTE